MQPSERSALHFNDIQGLERIAQHCVGESGSGNAIIQGDNLAVLERLLPRYCAAVRCIYIDPPYNNHERHYQYPDSLQHDNWLDTVTERIELLARLLRSDGSLWISIDDNEAHYLKVACDRIFGRHNFVSSIVWQQRTSRENRKVFSHNHEYLLVYAKDIDTFSRTRNALAMTPEVHKRYRNPDDDPRGAWQSVSANAQAGHATPAQFYTLQAPNGKQHRPPPGRCWVYSQQRMLELMEDARVWFGRHGDGVPRIKRFLCEARRGLTPETLWTANEVGTNDEAKKQLLHLFPDEPVFDTPKPERLLERVLSIASDPGDLIVDAYLGSGTTAAVAHKMHRHFIGIEEDRQIVALATARLHRVISGDDNTGITPAVDWQGGGFDFYRLL